MSAVDICVRRRIDSKMPRTGILSLMVILGLLISSCSKDTSEASTLDEDLTERLIAISQGQGLSYFTLPESDDLSSIPQDPLNPLTAAKIDLGRFLFHETGIAMNPALEQTVGMF
jgi:cytochrome c peroxidase